VPHPPHSPDFSPVDFFLFPKVKTTFQTTEEIKENAIRELRAITQSAFRDEFEQSKKRWDRCIASRGEYFERGSA
jgi:hypothetical protein